MQINSLTTQRLALVTCMLAELKDQLEEAEVSWDVMEVNEEDVTVPNIRLKFKGGQTLETTGVSKGKIRLRNNMT